jgi:PAS domain S-box-containing protein
MEVVAGAALVMLAGTHVIRTFRRTLSAATPETKERLHLLGRATDDIVYDFDIRRDEIWLSEAASKRYGYPAGPIAPAFDWCISRVHPDDRERVRQSAIEVGRGIAEIWTAAYHLRRGDETYAFVVDRGVLVRDERGALVRMVGTILDVGEQKAIEETLCRSEEQCHGLIERATDLILTIGPDAEILSANPATQRMTGWPLSGLVGTSIVPFVHHDDRHILTEGMSAVDREGSARLELRFLHKTGPYVDLEVSLSPKATVGPATGTIMIARDVTDRKLFASERDDLIEEIQLLLDSLTEGICAFDQQARCTLVNEAASSILGRPREELIGKQPHDVIPCATTDDRSPASGCSIRRVITTGLAETVPELSIRTPDGRVIHIAPSASPIVASGQIRGVVVSFEDLSGRRLLEGELERANRLGALGRVAARIAHEFNNVLMAIQPFSEIISRKSGDETVQAAASRIAAAVDRGSTVTKEILRFARAPEPNRIAIDAGRWFEELREEFQGTLPERIAFEMDVPTESLWLEGDREQLTEVVANIVINARDAMGGEGTLRLSAQRCFSGPSYDFGCLPTPDRFLHVVIADDGPGISEQNLEHIFEPFFTTKRNGTGLGLGIAHQIMRQHDGHIFVESAPGEGTSFHLFFPLSARTFFHEANVPYPEPVQGFIPGAVPAGLVLLVVEDDPDVALGIMTLLEESGIRGVRVEHGADVVPAIEQYSPTAVLLDLGLPDIPGEEVFDRIETRWPSLPVIVSSGHALPASVPGSGRRDVVFLPKPYDLDELLGALATVA